MQQRFGVYSKSEKKIQGPTIFFKKITLSPMRQTNGWGRDKCGRRETS